MRNTVGIPICGVLIGLASACHPGTTMAQSARGAAAVATANFNVATVPEDRVTAILSVDVMNPIAADSNPGTPAQPFRTIGAAVQVARSNNLKGVGTKISISPGIYREQILLPIESNATNAPIVIEAQRAGSVTIEGTDVWTGWQRQTGTNIYTHPWPYQWGLAAYPAGWEGNVVLTDIVRRREMLFVNDQLFQQVLTPSGLVDNSFYVSEQTGTIFLRLDGNTDITASQVEVSVRSPLFRAQGRTNLVLRGLTFHRGNPALPDAAVQVVDSSTVLIENCGFYVNNWDGLDVQVSNDVIIRSTIANNNGASGMSGFRLRRFLFEDSETSFNNWRGAEGGFYGWSVAGGEFSEIHDGLIQRYSSTSNQARGCWLDSDNINITVDFADVGQNYRDGIFIEANEGPIAIRNSYIHENLNAILGANSTDVSLNGNYFWANTQSQIQITGVLNREVSNWETGAQYTLSAERWTVDGNIIQSQSADQAWLTTPNWQPFLSSVASDDNLWLRQVDPRGFLIGTSIWTLQDWQKLTGVDLDSLAGSKLTNRFWPPPRFPVLGRRDLK
jgi:hypothetical protein